VQVLRKADWNQEKTKGGESTISFGGDATRLQVGVIRAISDGTRARRSFCTHWWMYVLPAEVLVLRELRYDGESEVLAA